MLRRSFILLALVAAGSFGSEAHAQGVWQDAPGDGPAMAGPTGSPEAIALADRSSQLRLGRVFVTPLAGALVGSAAGTLTGGLVWAACGGDCLLAASLLAFTAYAFTVPLGVIGAGRLMGGLGSNYWLQVLAVAAIGLTAVAMSSEMPAVGATLAAIFCPIMAMVVFESHSFSLESGLRSGKLEPESLAAVSPTIRPVHDSRGVVRGAAFGLAWRAF